MRTCNLQIIDSALLEHLQVPAKAMLYQIKQVSESAFVVKRDRLRRVVQSKFHSYIYDSIYLLDDWLEPAQFKFAFIGVFTVRTASRNTALWEMAATA